MLSKKKKMLLFSSVFYCLLLCIYCVHPISGWIIETKTWKMPNVMTIGSQFLVFSQKKFNSLRGHSPSTSSVTESTTSMTASTNDYDWDFDFSPTTAPTSSPSENIVQIKAHMSLNDVSSSVIDLNTQNAVIKTIATTMNVDQSIVTMKDYSVSLQTSSDTIIHSLRTLSNYYDVTMNFIVKVTIESTSNTTVISTFVNEKKSNILGSLESGALTTVLLQSAVTYNSTSLAVASVTNATIDGYTVNDSSGSSDDDEEQNQHNTYYDTLSALIGYIIAGVILLILFIFNCFVQYKEAQNPYMITIYPSEVSTVVSETSRSISGRSFSGLLPLRRMMSGASPSPSAFSTPRRFPGSPITSFRRINSALVVPTNSSSHGMNSSNHGPHPLVSLPTIASLQTITSGPTQDPILEAGSTSGTSTPPLVPSGIEII